MRVFVAGASGVIGRGLVSRLLARGHQVTAMTRTPGKAAGLERLGASPVVCDALDRAAVIEAVSTASPAVVVHQLTALPQKYDPRRVRALYRETDRLHVEGTDHLVAAAEHAGASAFVAQSVAFAYERVGDWIKDEDTVLDPDPPRSFADAGAALRHLEAAVAAVGNEMRAVVLRYGMFYGPGTWYSRDGYYGRETRGRRFPVVSGAKGLFSFVQVEDAAAATVLAIESDVSGVFNVVDDEPAPLAEWLPVFADAVGAPRPWRAPPWLARLAAGSDAVEQLRTMRGAANAKIKTELGWAPAHPTWRTGFSATLRERT